MPYAMDGVVVLQYVQPLINLYPMTLFAIISGFWYKNRPISRSVALYLWPCLVFSIANNLLGYFSHFPNFIHSFVFKAGYAMWYLLALFLFNTITGSLIKIGFVKCFILICIFAILVGFVPIPNRILDLQRISCLYPCFLFGILVKEKLGDRLYKLSDKTKIICFAILMLFVGINLYVRSIPFIRKYDSFTEYYGLNFYAAIIKWGLYALRLIACFCLIVLCPNIKFWFTKLGSKTMNAYLLHMIPIFLLCWGLLYESRYEWYAIAVSVFLIPVLSIFFMSNRVDTFMKAVLRK